MGWLNDDVALITGAGSGIGAAVAKRFVAEGARVVAMDLSGDRVRDLQAGAGDNLIGLQGDVRNWEDHVRAVDAAVSRWGKLDVFVGNAGIHDGGRKLADISPDEIASGLEQLIATNVRSCLLGAKAVAPELRKSRGNIIFTLSTSSFYVGGGGASLYVASKHAALGVMRALAFELAPDIRVNGVAPAGTPTNIGVAPALLKPGSALAGAERPAGSPRPGNLLAVALQPEDHAGAYVLLASRESRAMTGIVIGTDAGRGIR